MMSFISSVDTNMAVEQAVAYFRNHMSGYVEDLKTLVRIPGISFAGFPENEVLRSAEKVAEFLTKYGLENVQLLKMPGTHPYVYGERLHTPDAPTLLLYAHHDIQPPGNLDQWETDPFEPALKTGPGGERLYGRGTADDKAGILIHLAAISSFIQTCGELPVNIKMIVEGEEEIGSTHLPELLKTYHKLLMADILVLTGTLNFDSGIPALTVSLRGLVEFEIEVRALEKSLHSGLYGGPVPDPAMALIKGLSALMDNQGNITVPGLMDDVLLISGEEEADLKEIPYAEQTFREQIGLIPRAQLLDRGFYHPLTPLVQTWRIPSITINAIQASERHQAGNIINNAAWAKVSVRIVPNMEPQKVVKQLQDFLRAHIPWGLEVAFHVDACHSGWYTAAFGPAFEAAKKALTKGYGKPALTIGCGASIPFVKPFSEAFDVPVLLVGVEDPYTNAHGENESLLLSDFEKACISQIYLFDELVKTSSLKT